MPSPEPASRHPPLPTTLPQINLPSTSLGSKFAAHFGQNRSRKLASSPRSSQAGPSEGSASDTLSPPTSPRASSFDSASSSTNGNRPLTPRPGPTITVSLSPDNLDEYRDLFTLPRSKISSTPRRQSSTPASEYRDNYHKGDSNITLTPSPPTSPRLDFPTHSPDSRGDFAHREPRRLTESSLASRKSSKRRVIGSKRPDEVPDESAEESVRSTQAIHGTDVTPINEDTPPPPPRKPTSPVPRSRLRLPSSAKENASQPPSIPLPPPPNIRPPLPPISSPKPLSSSRSAALTNHEIAHRRPRASTLGTTPPSPPASDTITPSPSSPKRTAKLSLDNVTAAKQSSNKENSEIELSTVEQLKQALKTRNEQYDELATHFLEVTNAHAAERSVLEKKITALEAEASRKDKEIQGFTWMLNNRGLSGPTAAGENGVASRPHRSKSIASSKLSSRMFHSTDDSGAESHQTSGAESIRASDTSSSVHKIRRPLTLGETSYNLYRSSMSSKSASGRGPGADSGIPDMPVGKRSSVYSMSSSAASSTSSLLTPGSNVALSSLSAIPESGSVPNRPRRIASPVNTESLSASENDSDRRASRASQRISTSSLASSATATSAYSANLKRGRPPSIAQVLEKSPTTDDVLEKLRPFAGSTPVAKPYT